MSGASRRKLQGRLLGNPELHTKPPTFRTEWVERLLTWGIGIAVPAIAILGLGMLATDRHQSPAEVSSMQAAPAVGPATLGARSSESDRLPSGTNAHPSVSVFECWHDGTRTLSDRSCGPAAVHRDVTTDRMSTYIPPAIDTRRIESPNWAPERRPAPVNAPDSDSNGECELLEREIEQLNAAGRLPHSSYEADRLRDQWHALRDEAHALRMSRPLAASIPKETVNGRGDV